MSHNLHIFQVYYIDIFNNIYLLYTTKIFVYLIKITEYRHFEKTQLLIIVKFQVIELSCEISISKCTFHILISKLLISYSFFLIVLDFLILLYKM